MFSLSINILFLMILCHIIDDFVLQPICLSKLKQKDWWFDNIKEYKKYELYKNDYKMALLIHVLSWSIMIHLPLMFIKVNEIVLTISIIINCIIHYIVDDLKANKYKINLITDQSIHLIQIILIYLMFLFI